MWKQHENYASQFILDLTTNIPLLTRIHLTRMVLVPSLRETPTPKRLEAAQSGPQDGIDKTLKVVSTIYEIGNVGNVDFAYNRRMISIERALAVTTCTLMWSVYTFVWWQARPGRMQNLAVFQFRSWIRHSLNLVPSVANVCIRMRLDWFRGIVCVVLNARAWIARWPVSTRCAKAALHLTIEIFYKTEFPPECWMEELITW